MKSPASCRSSSKAIRTPPEQLLPLVYDELRKLAAQRLAHEKPGQTLQATALVHEAYLRLVDVEQAQKWNSRGHFFAAAAEAMRRILVERARHKGRIQHGGGLRRVDLLDADATGPTDDEQVLLLDEALTRLAAARPQAAELVKLRFFAGMTLEEIAPILALSPRTPPGGSGSSPVPGCDGTWSGRMSPRPEPRRIGASFSQEFWPLSRHHVALAS